jgi:subtilisin family serine protease
MACLSRAVHVLGEIMRVRVLAAVLMVFGFASGVSRAAPASADPAGQPADGAEGIIVKFKDGATLADVGDALADSETVATGSADRSKLVFLDPVAGQSLDAAIEDLNNHPNVELAEPDRIVSIAATPNDDYYGSQWHYPQINLPTAWDTTQGSASVVVAVIDTGVLSTHPDLNNKLTGGYDFYNNDANPNDDHGHGTFVAGIVAAESNNADWVAGVCWECKIMPIKALGSAGTGPTSAVIDGIDHAVANGAEVINLSLGSTAPDPLLEIAVNNAVSSGVVVVAASGNTNSAVLYPAAYPNVIAVGASDAAGNRASFSNYGPELDVMAPGDGVYSTVRTGAGGFGYGSGSGTSFAAPHVAGLAGLMISAGITGPSTIAQKLKDTATEMGAAGFDNLTGHGRINAAAAVVDDTTPPIASITAPAPGIVAGSVAFSATASDNVGVQKVRFWVDSTYLGYDQTFPYSKTWDTTSFLNGKHTLKIEALDLENNSTVKTRVITVVNPDSTPPTVSITAPGDGSTVSGTSVTVTADATDTQGLQKVQFWVGTTYLGYDATAPYSKTFNSEQFVNASRVITARAVDWANNTTIDSVTVTISNDDTTPPTVSVSSPSDGATISGTITITATANDDVGVQKVQFWVDGTYLGYDSAAAYTRIWDSSSVANGAHTIKVRAVDNANNFSTEVTISVNVNN